MADQNKPYRTIIGFVQFDPQTRQVGKVTVRGIRVNHNDKSVDVTVWPDHDTVVLERNDAVLIEGPMETKNGQTQAGEARTFYNLSAKRIINLSRLGGSTPVSDEDNDTEPGDDPGF